MRDAPQSPRRSLFSARTSWDTSESEWARTLVARRATHRPIYDLTTANPTECSFHYPDDLLESLAGAPGLIYSADPQGLLSAREAVCTYYRDHQQAQFPSEALSLGPDQLVLTTSTSEAYSFLFRLLCDPGDEVLIAQPSYPLFDFLAELDNVRLVSYPLFYDYGWHLDLHRLRQLITDRTRAIVIVHPNNPTGHFTSAEDRRSLEELGVKFELALIVDEVFLDYSFAGHHASFALGEHPALTFVMSGLSKVCGLPQMKLSWIAAFGPAIGLQQASQRLEIISDTFLSVSTPIQQALPAWLAGRHSMQQQIRGRVTENQRTLDELLAVYRDVQHLVCEGGWYAILRVPALSSGEEAALQLLSQQGIVVHAGVFFGLPEAGRLVLSLLSPPLEFRESLQKLLVAVYQLIGK